MEANKYKIGIIGSHDIILPFRMIGFDIFPAYQEQEAINTLRKLAQSDYGVIYITEDIASMILDTIRHYDSQVVPAIILLPTHKQGLNLGLKRIEDNVEKAVGHNIL